MEHLLLGPFDFERRESADDTYSRQWRYRIHCNMWERLKMVEAERGLNTQDIDQQAIVCLGVKPTK